MAYLKDISAVLGVSVSTVSKALKGYSDISEDTRKKVIRAAEELDYSYRGEKNPCAVRRAGGAVAVGAGQLAVAGVEAVGHHHLEAPRAEHGDGGCHLVGADGPGRCGQSHAAAGVEGGWCIHLVG